MIIKKYNNFLYQMLLESMLIASSDFQSLIYNIYYRYRQEKYGELAGFIYSAIRNGSDINTNYNNIQLSDKNDEISFLPDSQFQRFLSKNEDPYTKIKSKSKIGRFFRQILTDNKVSFTDADLEKLTNLFKTEWDRKHGLTKKIEIVKGDKILYWYNCLNYYDDGGTLGNSCMKGSAKNKFMKIYAENPDKISMVILTDDDKLIGRAILWNLDKSIAGRKYFLDRIYTRNDSDQEYVTNWVLENVAKGKSDVIGFYNKSKRDDMYCNLNKVEFDDYRYADTMHFLYKKLINGTTSEQGIISNTNDQELHDEYMVFDMQDTNGSLSPISHVFSDHLKVWIKVEDAKWAEGIGYIYEKDAKYCNTLSLWYSNEDVIFSEILNDWIPKLKAINHPKYGIILNSMLVDVIVEYIGDKTNPIDIVEEFISENQENFKSEKFYRKDTSSYFITSKTPNTWISRYQYFDKKFSVFDINGSESPNIFCYKVYNTGIKTSDFTNNDILSVNVTSPEGYVYITEIDANFLDIEINKDKYEYVYFYDFINKECFIEYELKKDDFKVNDVIRKKYYDQILSIHEYLMSHNNSYRKGFNIKRIFKIKLKLNLEQFIIKKAYELVEGLEKNPKFIKNGGIETCVRKVYDVSNDTDITHIMELMKPFYAFYILTGDRSDSEYHLEQFLKEKRIDRSIIKLTSEVRHLFYYEFSGILNTEWNNIISSLLKEVHNSLTRAEIFDFNEYDLNRYMRSVANLDKFNKYLTINL